MALESPCEDKKGVGGTFRSVVSKEAEGAVWLREAYRGKQRYEETRIFIPPFGD